MIATAFILACAPGVSPMTIQEIVRVESNHNPIAVNINLKNGIPFPYKKPKTKTQAIAVAHAAIAAGHTVDMGYMQVNSANLKSLGYTVREMFHECTNLKAGSHILKTAYNDAAQKHGPGQTALRAALSRYNTGSFSRGFYNGYVARYMNLPKKPVMVASNPYTAETSVWRR
jgi:type IV secretion system protein VirB1